MSRDYVFTAWTLPEPDIEKCKYICWGREKCPETDRVHYQGFAVFNRTYRIPGAKRVLGCGDGCHLEVKCGTRDQARDYCRKDGEFTEIGTFEPLTMRELFGKPIGFLKENYPEFYCRYWKGLAQLQVSMKEWRTLKVIWLWGPPGCGKTREAMENDDVFKLDRPFKWWDGYDGQSILLLDDVDKHDFRENRGMFLNVLDGYPLRLDIKGSHTYANWTKVYITSNWEPDCLMAQTEWSRRVTSVRAAG